jgi:hypothetical protein
MNNQATESSIANVFKFEDVPPIGEYWEGQGGYYGGIVRDGEHQWHLIMTSHALSDIEWGKYGNEIAGQFSRRDGLHNTQLILAGEPENAAAKFITSVNADGHGDCYWPSQGEQDLLNLNLPEHTDGKCYWSSTQCSSHGAWCQHFEDGYTYFDSKASKLAVRAVRRVAIK